MYPDQKNLEQLIVSILPMIQLDIPEEKISWLAARIIDGGWHRVQNSEILILETDLHKNGQYIACPIGKLEDMLGKGSELILTKKRIPEGKLKGKYDISTGSST